MVKLTIDNQEVEVEEGSTVIQAAEKLGVEIPRFCYHERLEIAGNCRMCLVEVSPGPPKPAASCALPVAEGMVVKTDTPMVKKAREGVMEFLLINHPLDCPICDQGGECDLQDQAIKYGAGKSRFELNKRAVEDKYMGPLIKTHMTRCIHCTRCIRFATDVAGVPELGAFNRGENMSVGTYVEQAVTSEMSGNMIDLCPVGALTSKPYAFAARPWELKKTESIDVLDAVGSNIRVDSRGEAVLRIMPRLNEAVNEEWISDKTRFACDGLSAQRLDKPYVKENGRLQPASWDDAFDKIKQQVEQLKGRNIAALAGNMVDVEAMVAMKDLMKNLESENLDCRIDAAKLPSKNRSDYLFNTTIEGIEDADFCLIVGADIRKEAAVINTRLRKRFLQGEFEVANIGEDIDFTYPVDYLGNDLQVLSKILGGKHDIAKKLKKAKNPMIIVGQQALAREDGAEVFGICKAIAKEFKLVKKGWNGFNVLHNAAARAGGLDVGFVPGKTGMDTAAILEGAKIKTIRLLFVMGVDDEIDPEFYADAFVVYIGHHGDVGASRADVVLPASAYTEKSGIYVNTEGRVQMTTRAVFPKGEAKEDWAIIRAMSEKLGKKLSYDSLAELRKRIFKEFKHMQHQDVIAENKWDEGKVKANYKIGKDPVYPAFENFYMSDVISKNSKTMAECTKHILELGKKETKKAA